jgi:Yip1-like protein
MSLQTRVVAILTKPADEWRTIAAEPATVEGLLRGYAAPLAAIPAIAQFIGFSLIGITVPVFGGAIRVGIMRSIANAIVSWVLALVGAWIAAVVIEKLAPTFQSRGNTAQALKLVVYSMTPIWIAGVLYVVPALIPLVIIGVLYAIYLFYLGLAPVMSTPSEKVIPYMVVSALVIFVVSLILGAITGAISGIGGYGTF